MSDSLLAPASAAAMAEAREARRPVGEGNKRRGKHCRRRHRFALHPPSGPIESLREFFASRNCTNRLSRYSEIAESSDEESPSDDENGGRAAIFPFMEYIRAQQRQKQQRARSSGPLKLATETRSRLEVPRRHLEECAAAASIIKFPDNSRKGAPKRKSSVVFLLGALLFNSKRRTGGFQNGPQTRAQVFARLLKLPAVLGALFSLSLVITLLVLYTLNFYHCEQLRLRSGPRETDGHNESRARLGQSTASTGGQPEKGNGSGDELGARVSTECGQHVGRASNGAFEFRAIPYAAPPIGPRRWHRAQPIWRNEQLCRPHKKAPNNTNRKPEQDDELRQQPPAAQHCLQLSPFSEQKQLTGSEDCLYLDIFMPAGANMLPEVSFSPFPPSQII